MPYMRYYLPFTVFVAGMITLAAEMGAARLLQMRFGNANLVWAVIIGLILIYLAVGYLLGGRLADRSPVPKTLFLILAWGGTTLGLAPIVAQPILLAAAQAFDALNFGVMAGTFASALILFSVPVTLLGMVSPFALRILLHDLRRAGNAAGSLYALSTLGSVIGVFLPTLFLFSWIGTSRTLLLSGVFLLIVAVVGLALSRAFRSAWLFALAALALLGYAFFGDFRVKATPGQVFESESAYNYIQVLQQDGYTLLRLNEGQGVHSIYHPHILFYGGVWELFLVGPYFYPNVQPADIHRIGIVGLAAGTTARQALAIYGPIPIDGWEIDPQIVQVGRTYFGMTMPNLNVFIEDGRVGLERSPHRYDILAVDAYRPPYIPPHMTTREFFAIAASHLTPRGVLAINVGRTPSDRSLINGLATTLATFFSSVHIVDVPGSLNSIIYATQHPTSPADFTANLERLQNDPSTPPLLIQTMLLAIEQLQPSYQTTLVFTDDRTPIEWLTDRLILNFFLYEQ